ncbi:MAG: secondary thiamine-phosphate synthase enzyme YjbQ [Roseiflexus sp.]|nr:secondary thiamine-phosphate synthase enzyme YjbQ [Roseiflexus sp.]
MTVTTWKVTVTWGLEGSKPMRSYREELWFNTPTRVAFVRITDQVAAAVRKSGVREGLCLVNAMHITASVFVNDNEPGLWHDFERWLEKLAPHAPISQYRHNDTGEDNADAHLKRTIMGREVVLAITDGKLDLGPWEEVFYGEFDGQRRKRVLIKIIGE